MTYQVWVRIGDLEWTFTEDPDHGQLTDDVTVLSGMNFGWLMKGPLWPRQPEPMHAAVQINLPEFVDFTAATTPDEGADRTFLAIEVKVDSADSACIARFYGDITDLQAVPREAPLQGVVLSVAAIDYTAGWRSRQYAPYVVVDDATPWTDEELIADLWAFGDVTGLGDPGCVVGWPVGLTQTIDDAYLNLDGPLPYRLPEFLATLLDGAISNGDGAIGADFRLVFAPLVADDSYAPNHGRRIDGVVAGSLTGVYYTLDYVLSDVLNLPKVWEIDAGVTGAGVLMDQLVWRNLKGETVGLVTTAGFDGASTNQTVSAVTGANSDMVENVPVFIQDEVNAQGTGDYYAERAGFEPWQVEGITIPVTRILAAGGDLNAADLELFPNLTLQETDPVQRGQAYSTGLHITNVDDTVTPEGTTDIEGIIVGVECVVDDEGLSLQIALRRTEIAATAPVTFLSAGITIAAGEVSSDLTGFVTRVDLSHITSVDWWDMCTSDGGNIRIVDGADVPRPFDVTWIDTATRTGELFFRSNLATATDNEFFATVEVGETALPTTDTYGRNAVWQDYETVVTPGSDYRAGVSPVDRTGQGAVPAIVGSGVTLTADGWKWSSSATGYVKVTGVSYLGTTFTMGCRARQDVNDATQRIMLCYAAAGNINGQDRVYLKARQTGTDRFAITTNVGGDLLSTTGVQPSLYLNTFKRWNVVHNGSTSRWFYVDGGSAGTPAGASTGRPSNADALILGSSDAVSSTSGTWRGEITGPIYLRNGILSAAWIAAESSSWNAPSGFYTVT